jgi:hypothetical protein
MGVRAPIDKHALAQAMALADKQQARIYALWIIGIFVGILDVKVQSLSVTGMSLLVGKPELIQGLLFWAALLFYIALIARTIATLALTTPSNFAERRRSLYYALGSRKTLRGRSTINIRLTKGLARGLSVTYLLLQLFYTLLPAVAIIGWERDALGKVIEALAVSP